MFRYNNDWNTTLPAAFTIPTHYVVEDGTDPALAKKFGVKYQIAQERKQQMIIDEMPMEVDTDTIEIEVGEMAPIVVSYGTPHYTVDKGDNIIGFTPASDLIDITLTVDGQESEEKPSSKFAFVSHEENIVGGGQAGAQTQSTISLAGTEDTLSLFEAPATIAELSEPEQTIYVYGLEPGTTTVTITDQDGDTHEIDVTVNPKTLVMDLGEMRKITGTNSEWGMVGNVDTVGESIEILAPAAASLGVYTEHAFYLHATDPGATTVSVLVENAIE